MVQAVIFLSYSACMFLAMSYDLLRMEIPNPISCTLVVVFLSLSLSVEFELRFYALHLITSGAVLGITFALFASGAMGGGDAKLIAATALWMGPDLPLAQYLVWGAMLGGVLTLVLLALRYSPLAAPASNTRLFRHLADRNAGIPYGIALGAAGLLAFPASPLGAWALAQM